MTYQVISDLSHNHNQRVQKVADEAGHFFIKKEIAPSQLEVYTRLKRLQDESPNTALGIPYIYGIYAEDAQNTSPYIIEEFITGNTLDSLLKLQLFSEKDATKLLLSLCDILGPLHKNKIIHRDITPKNIIITFDGAPHLIDFGISRIEKGDKAQDTTFWGTKGYIAPEQFGFSETDGRADIYSVGVLFNVMLTGSTLENGIYAKNKPIFRLISRCVQIDRTLRYKNIKELKYALCCCLTEFAPLPIRILRQIPGFRTKNPLKMIFALWMYACYVPLMFMFFVFWHDPFWEVFCVIGIWIFVFIIPFVLITNLAQWRQRLPIFRRIPSRLLQALISWFVAGISFLGGMFFFLPLD